MYWINFLLIGIDLALVGRFLGDIINDFSRIGLDQNGSIELDGSLFSGDIMLAVAGTKLRSVTKGKKSRSLDLDRAICSVLAGVMCKIVINNGSAIESDNQLIVDSFMLFYVRMMIVFGSLLGDRISDRD
jgi:hypothetical protein